MVKFYIVLGTNLLRVTTSDDAHIYSTLRYLKSESAAARRILRGISYDQCDYYKLKNPVPLPDEVDPDQIVQTCMKQSNWEQVLPDDTLDVPSTTLLDRHVYMVIQPQDGRIVAVLNRDHTEIFSRLQIGVTRLHRWMEHDIMLNMAGGRLYHPYYKHPVELSDIEASLTQRRTYNVPRAQENMDYQNARQYAEHFHTVFESTPNQSGNVTDREFVAFFNVLRCFVKDSSDISADSSSALKASNFIFYFIFPPFFSRRSKHFELKQKKYWDFPIFIDIHDEPNFWCQFHPRSDFMVSSPSFFIPFLVCEVSSGNGEEGRHRMLLQAIAAARAGQFLMVDDAPKPFFVVAIYVSGNFTVERHVVTNTTPTEEEKENCQVSIAQKDFHLTTSNDAVTFLREMYNLVGMFEELAKHLDKRKRDILLNINQDSSKMISLTSMAKEDWTGALTSSSTDDVDSYNGFETDFGVFDADDIQAILQRINYKIIFSPVGYPLIASVSNVSDESEKGYLKFVKEERKEIETLQYLTEIDSPMNHTISGVRIWSVRGGNVILMPVAGASLTSLANPSQHLWSVAKQLFEAVDFMHQHGVAHMDLKPRNILIPVYGGRLTVIDFNRSLRVKGVEHMFRGVVGTPGYMAPEVEAGDGPYSAIRADLWSCGMTLEELCDECRPSTDRDTLLEISWQLMDEDPKKRPMMSEVLDRLTRGTLPRDQVP